ncbi:hypothetical protein C0Q70_07820 [Pomacea canaliculata]|uniref:EF-hand domain-containing protein n=1 Tax=Pomacea canaliculata TaxID=400727 RepID=A0A2T7PG42_POMCA|nr:peflin-like isoform X2 [Pomacea canaliculata]PVD32386.1 hypothetical protein C0Q70_07820 [Pomacea canaliculata]
MSYPGQPGYGAPHYGQQGAYGAPNPGGYGAPAGYAGGYGGAPPPGGYGPPAGQFGAPQGIDPQIIQWFQAVDQDRSGRITANELQRALVNANWSQFNPETCRLMIGMFDRDMSGTIDINEFQSLWHYIQQWRSTFERYDSNRSGSIEAAELHTVYQQMGYNISPQFVQTVLYKFDHYGRRSLTLDLFIQSCVLLKSLTDAFRQRDTNMSGTINLSYEDFMTMAVLYKP